MDFFRLKFLNAVVVLEVGGASCVGGVQPRFAEGASCLGFNSTVATPEPRAFSRHPNPHPIPTNKYIPQMRERQRVLLLQIKLVQSERFTLLWHTWQQWIAHSHQLPAHALVKLSRLLLPLCTHTTPGPFVNLSADLSFQPRLPPATPSAILP
ncbi:unnamed protein product [Ectocarpus sp. 4 AP-2014]